MRNIISSLCLLLLTNSVRVSGRKHHGKVNPLFHSGPRGTFKVVDTSQMNGEDKKLQATKKSSSSKSLAEEHADEGHEEHLNTEWAWLQNGELMSPPPDNYVEIQHCNKNNLKEGWKVNTCFLCTDGSDAEFSCIVTYESKVVFEVFSGTSCDGESIATDDMQISGSTGCGDGVDSIATYLELSTPYLIDDLEVGFSWSAFYGSCRSVSPFFYSKPQLFPIAGTSDFCFNEYEDGDVYSYTVTSGCNWLQEHDGANCEEEALYAEYRRGLHGMCFPHETDPEWIHEDFIGFNNLGYSINTTFKSMNTLMQSWGSSCGTGSPTPIACLTKTGLPCPFYTKDRESMFKKNCKSDDKHAGAYIRHMTGTSYTNETDGISYASVSVHLLLPDDAQVGEKYKFVSTLFDTNKQEQKVRLSKAIYTLAAADVSRRSLSFELFDPLPFAVDVGKHNSLRLKVKRHDPNADTRPFVRASCARFIWGEHSIPMPREVCRDGQYNSLARFGWCEGAPHHVDNQDSCESGGYFWNTESCDTVITEHLEYMASDYGVDFSGGFAATCDSNIGDHTVADEVWHLGSTCCHDRASVCSGPIPSSREVCRDGQYNSSARYGWCEGAPHYDDQDLCESSGYTWRTASCDSVITDHYGYLAREYGVDFSGGFAATCDSNTGDHTVADEVWHLVSTCCHDGGSVCSGPD